ncbi:ABC transporter ATP-binding protein [Bullifex porci]|uniref:ABC transporter ATP-binding protein n=1 Tax=Bullifex porci TaxID=2606638 RepID=UPI0023F3270B|nr:ABC transporter ATP-binding protein [Bullifex porci]MDD7254748.1 ABC transporter ATP-binding protein [Bullifex porci]MDY2741183.1 ABC transporter ATP-binding protein [Bullifex porci]
MKESNQRRVLIRILKYLSSYRKSVIIVISIMTISSIISVILPFLAKDVIDNKIPLGKINAVLSVILIYIILALILSLLSIIRVRIMSRVSNKVVLKIRDEVFKHLQTLDLHYFNSHPTGNILSRIIGDISSLKQLVTQLVSTLIPQTMFLISLIIAMVVLNPVLAFGSLLSLPIVLIGTFIIMRVNFKRWYDYRKKQSELAGFSHEAFAGIKVIQSLACEEAEKKSFEKINDDILSSWIRCVRFGDTLGIIIDLSIGIGFLFLFLFAIYIDHSTVGELIAFSTYIMLFWQPIKALAQMFNQVSNNLSGASRVFEILDEKSYILDSPQAIELPKIKGEVEFKNVSFSYPDDKESLIIENINFTVKAGERIALVGPTGAGKTTIINLLSRFYDPIKGSILVDGYDIKELSTASLRKQLGIMTQDSFLFSGTIKENLTYGCENVSDEAIVNACKVIGCHNFISKLQSGYDTLISSLTLSMGQKQLLALARTLIKDPRILILDEATSNIDTQTELLVQNGISKLMSGRTCFIVAHRLSTIKNSDRIFVLDDNKIIEEGSHEELIKLNGFYTMLYNSQFEGGIN